MVILLSTVWQHYYWYSNA